MSNKNQFHVSKDDTDWKVTQNGKKFENFPTQSKAIDYAKTLAKVVGGEVVTHRENGKIRAKDSYGNDPFPPRG